MNSHYASIFGAALAVGAIGGLAQIGKNAASLSNLSEFRNGVSASTAQSADRILDRFLNRLPTITIREGTRVKIILTDDWRCPPINQKESNNHATQHRTSVALPPWPRSRHPQIHSVRNVGHGGDLCLALFGAFVLQPVENRLRHLRPTTIQHERSPRK